MVKGQEDKKVMAEQNPLNMGQALKCPSCTQSHYRSVLARFG
jgi:hypothetical protein